MIPNSITKRTISVARIRLVATGNASWLFVLFSGPKSIVDRIDYANDTVQQQKDH